MKIKSNGFTLIELLAVILILGIIALIAIPTVNKIIDDSKRGAFETAANNIVKAIEDACELEILKNKTITTEYVFSNSGVLPKLNIKGKLPNNGTATVGSNCNVAISVSDGKFTASKNYTDDRVTVITDGDPVTYPVYANGTAVYFNPETGQKCTSAQTVSITGTKSGCMKWYAFNDSSTNSNINLLLDHNTTATIAWNSGETNLNGPTNILSQLAADTASWIGVPERTDSYNFNSSGANFTINYLSYRARLISAGEVAKIIGISNFIETTASSTDGFILDNIDTQSPYAWLFDYTEKCKNYGCNYEAQDNYGYWTSTPVSNHQDLVWAVLYYKYIDYDIMRSPDFVGIRPVITIPKSYL